MRPLRIDPERVLRVLRVLRWLRVIGTLPDPVRVDPVLVLVLPPVVAVVAVAPFAVAGPAMPHTLQ